MLTQLLTQATLKSIPLNHDDKDFLQRELQKIPYNKRKEVINTYLDIWHGAMLKFESVRHIAHTGRYNANLYMLGVVSNYEDKKCKEL